MFDDRFGERIILSNKKKVRPSANAKIDEFLGITMALNVLSLWLYKEAVLQATDTIFHGNYYSFIAKLPDVSLLAKHMINNSIFKEKLGCTSMSNNTAISAFPDFFYIGSAHLSNNIALSRYIDSTQDNYNNFNLDNGFMSNTANDDGLESEPEDPNGHGDNPNDPNKLDRIYD